MANLVDVDGRPQLLSAVYTDQNVDQFAHRSHSLTWQSDAWRCFSAPR